MAQAKAPSNDNVEIAKELFSTTDESLVPVKAKVIGKLPEWFEGTLMRVGPAKFEWGKSNYNHWFDGQSLMHKFVVKNGEVHYSSKYLHSTSYGRSKKYGRVAMPEFGTWAPPDPCKNIFQRFFLYFLPPELTDNCNVNYVCMEDEVYVSTETPYIYHIDPTTTGTLEKESLMSVLSGPRSLLAHPHQDDEGNVYNISADWFKFQYEIFKVSPDATSSNPFAGAEVVGTVPFSFFGPAYFHSFGLSENYFILIENPLVLGVFWKALIMNLMKYSYLDILKWKPELKSRIHIVDRKGGKLVKTYTTENFFAFHHVNAYEENGNVIVDICGYPDTSVLNAFYLRNLRKALEGVTFNMPMLRRYKIPVQSCNVETNEPEPLPKMLNGDEFEVILQHFEMPRINYSYNGKKYKYAYGTKFGEESIFFVSLGKINVETKEAVFWSEEHCYPSEPVFVQRPGTTEEDDGIVLSAVVGVLGKPSFLLMLDGKTFKEIARAVVPGRLAQTFHGICLQ